METMEMVAPRHRPAGLGLTQGHGFRDGWSERFWLWKAEKDMLAVGWADRAKQSRANTVAESTGSGFKSQLWTSAFTSLECQFLHP